MRIWPFCHLVGDFNPWSQFYQTFLLCYFFPFLCLSLSVASCTYFFHLLQTLNSKFSYNRCFNYIDFIYYIFSFLLSSSQFCSTWRVFRLRFRDAPSSSSSTSWPSTATRSPTPTRISRFHRVSSSDPCFGFFKLLKGLVQRFRT